MSQMYYIATKREFYGEVARYGFVEDHELAPISGTSFERSMEFDSLDDAKEYVDTDDESPYHTGHNEVGRWELKILDEYEAYRFSCVLIHEDLSILDWDHCTDPDNPTDEEINEACATANDAAWEALEEASSAMNYPPKKYKTMNPDLINVPLLDAEFIGWRTDAAEVRSLVFLAGQSLLTNEEFVRVVRPLMDEDRGFALDLLAKFSSNLVPRFFKDCPWLSDGDFVLELFQKNKTEDPILWEAKNIQIFERLTDKCLLKNFEFVSSATKITDWVLNSPLKKQILHNPDFPKLVLQTMQDNPTFRLNSASAEHAILSAQTKHEGIPDKVIRLNRKRIVAIGNAPDILAIPVICFSTIHWTDNELEPTNGVPIFLGLPEDLRSSRCTSGNSFFCPGVQRMDFEPYFGEPLKNSLTAEQGLTLDFSVNAQNAHSDLGHLNGHPDPVGGGTTSSQIISAQLTTLYLTVFFDSPKKKNPAWQSGLNDNWVKIKEGTGGSIPGVLAPESTLSERVAAHLAWMSPDADFTLRMKEGAKFFGVDSTLDEVPLAAVKTVAKLAKFHSTDLELSVKAQISASYANEFVPEFLKLALCALASAQAVASGDTDLANIRRAEQKALDLASPYFCGLDKFPSPASNVATNSPILSKGSEKCGYTA